MDPLPQPDERRVLFARRGRDALRVGGGVGRRRDDRIQRLERPSGQLLHASHVHLPPAHLLHHLSHLPVDVLHQLRRLGRRRGALLGQVPHLLGHHGEALAVLARPRRLDRRVQCQQVGHVG
ncbi:MAG: hypothetical protein AUH42_01700 [Gemmatimonadetes bacterium 13_1_40CM_70_11]|nr:MAG: hypothetical protein AUH42_01700 [Gemmatimonadetes bacterium 13_1_40CM_70_11]